MTAGRSPREIIAAVLQADLHRDGVAISANDRADAILAALAAHGLAICRCEKPVGSASDPTNVWVQGVWVPLHVGVDHG